MSKEIGYSCFVCGNHIENYGGVDPCAVDLIANIDMPSNKDNYQRFYCHIGCFKNINKYASIYKSTFDDAVN